MRRRVLAFLVGKTTLTMIFAWRCARVCARVRRLNLIRGTIDQPASVASISWVQPRVLDRDQIAGLRDRLGDWSDKVTAMGEFVRSEGRELFVQ